MARCSPSIVSRAVLSVPNASITNPNQADHNDARRSASLRRIAIVIGDLPAPVASTLLASLDESSRRHVRREAARLRQIDPSERRRALESFTGSLRRRVDRRHSVDELADPDGIQDEFVLSDQAAANDRRPKTRPSELSSVAGSRLAEIIDDVSDEDLLQLLAGERSQTAAVVLAQMPPGRAASLIPKMSLAMRREVLTRIGRLQSVPDEMIQELATAFSRRVDELSGQRHTKQLRELLAPLSATAGQSGDAMPSRGQVVEHIPAEALSASPSLRAILDEMTPSSTSNPTSPHDSGYEGQAIGRSEITDRVDAETHLRQLARISQAAAPPNGSHSVQTPPPRSTDEIHRALVAMPAKRLCETLASVPTRTAMLTLCGLPNDSAEAVIGCLPRSQANQVRKQLGAMGTLELRDIDNAKESVFMAAERITPIDSTQAVPSATEADSSRRPLAA